MSDPCLGEFEPVVLLAVVRLAEGAYGVPIRREIEKRAGRRVTVGSLCSMLDRLEAKGYRSSWLADPTAGRGGRSPRKCRTPVFALALLPGAPGGRCSHFLRVST